MNEQNSIHALFKELGEEFVKNRLTALNAIYPKVLKKQVRDEDLVHWREDFAVFCYNTRFDGHYDDVNDLEELVEQFDGETDSDPMMRFLCSLASSVPHSSRKTRLPLGWTNKGRAEECILPKHGYYNDTQVFQGVTEYMMYRDELFEGPECEEEDRVEQDLKAILPNPSFSRFICPVPADNAPRLNAIAYQIPLLQDLPALPAPSQNSIFKSLVVARRNREKIHARKITYQPQQQVPLEDSDMVAVHSEIDENNRSWEQAFQDMDKVFPTPTFESRGRKVKQEKPYLSEAGHEIFSDFCSLISAPTSLSGITMLTEEQVIHQCRYVLIGAETSIFRFSQVEGILVPVPGVYYKGVSPDTLNHTLHTVAYTGTLYMRLQDLCVRWGVPGLHGNIVQGLITALSQYLSLYHLYINNMPLNSMLQLVWSIKDLTAQLEFLCSLLLPPEGLPVGVTLLNYLFDTTELLGHSPHNSLVLCLFKAACVPYIKFLSLWLHEGRVWDEWEEFHIAEHPHWMGNRDFMFWQHAYTWRDRVNCPKFIEPLQQELFNCGKLINLLKQCAPDHPLCVSKVSSPDIVIQYNQEEITLSTILWDNYAATLNGELESRRAIKLMEEQEKVEMRKAKILAAQLDTKRRMKMITDEVTRLQQRTETNKKAELERLQKQMLDKAEERAVLLESDRREDKEREMLRNTEQYELIGRVRTQLEEYYSSLTKEAERRERRSMWRLQRMKLGRLRKAFLVLEDINLAQELRNPRPPPPPTPPPPAPPTAAIPSTSLSTPSLPILQQQDQTIDSEISFDLNSPNISVIIPENIPETQNIPENILKTPIPDPAEEPSSSQLTKSRDESISKESMKDILYGGPLNETHQQRSYEPASQIQDILHGEGCPDKTPEIRSYEPAGQMEKILYEEGERVVIEKREYEPKGQMEHILYESGQAEEIEKRSYEPEGQMRDILYANDTVRAPVEVRQYERESQMQQILYETNAAESKVDPTRRFEPEGQMEALLYDNDNMSVEGPRALRQFEPEGTIQDIMYGEGSAVEERPLRSYEPEGQMKDLLYPMKEENVVEVKEEVVKSKEEGNIENNKDLAVPTPYKDTSDSGYEEDLIDPIQKSFPELDCPPNPHIMSLRLNKHIVKANGPASAEIDEHRSLEIIVKRSLLYPLLTMTTLINNAAVKYFLDELKINDHFTNLRSYLCMSNGEFGTSLANGIFTLIDSNVDLTCQPGALGSVLHVALQTSFSIHAEDKLALKTIDSSDIDPLSHLFLDYEVGWPCNVIITEETLQKYNQVFRFLMQLKHTCHSLDKIWYNLKGASPATQSMSTQVRKLQSCRYEVAQCIHAVQVYMAHQLHDISWHELQNTLPNVTSLSELTLLHDNFLVQVHERLMLSDALKAPYTMLQKMFSHVMTFRSILESKQWQQSDDGPVHPNFGQLIHKHNDFGKQAEFILKIAESCNSSGYKPYIEDFILRLDFNHYYSEQSNKRSSRRLSLGPRGAVMANQTI